MGKTKPHVKISYVLHMSSGGDLRGGSSRFALYITQHLPARVKRPGNGNPVQSPGAAATVPT